MAISILGTITVVDITVKMTGVTTTETVTGHVVTSGTDCLLALWDTRKYISSSNPAFNAKWGAVDLVQAFRNYDAAAVTDDVVVWIALLPNPAAGAGNFVFDTNNQFQRGGTLLLINLQGVDLANSIGAVDQQVRATSSTSAVALSVEPETAGNLLLALFGVAVATTLSTFTGAGFTAIVTGQTTQNNTLTRTVRYKLAANGVSPAGATFAAGAIAIGGVLIEIRAASTAVTETIASACTPTVAHAAALSSSAKAPAAAWWDRRPAWTAALVYQADDVNVDRQVLRIGSGPTSTFALRRRAVGPGGGAASVITAQYQLDDGTVKLESAASQQTDGLSLVTLGQAVGQNGELWIDGESLVPSYREGAGLAGNLALGGLAVEVGNHSDAATLLPFAGRLGRWIVDSQKWTIEQHRLLWRALTAPDFLWAQGEANLASDRNRSPLALPIQAVLTGSTIDITPDTLDPDGTAPTLDSVTQPSIGGVVTIQPTGKMRLTVTPGYVDLVRWTYTVTDGAKSSTAPVEVEVRASPLVAVADAVSVQSGVALTFDPRANDSGGVGPLRVASVTAPAHGTADLGSDGRVTYKSTAGYTGTDAFTYTLTDGVSSITAAVTVTVAASPAASAQADSVTVVAGVSKLIDVLANDSPADVTLDAITVAAGKGATAIESAKVRYTPASGKLGGDAFTYRIRRSANNTTSLAVVSINIVKASVNASGLPWPSGVDAIGDGNLTDYAQWATWRGRAVDCATCFIGNAYTEPGKLKSGWKGSFATRRNGQIETMKNAGIIPVLAAPLLMNEDAHLFSKAKNDADYGAAYQDVANDLRAIYGANATTPVYVRIGWEANKGYPWSFDGGSQLGDYVAAWRRFATILKNTVPNVLTVWNHLKEGGAFGTYYPGDDYVDVIGLDFYDNGWFGGYCNSEVNWQKQKGVYVAGGQTNGWDGFAKFAKAHGKKISFDEWGASLNKDGFSPDNPCNNGFFAGRFFDWMQDLVAADPGCIAFENYFNGNTANRILERNGSVSVNLPKVAAAYKAAYKP